MGNQHSYWDYPEGTNCLYKTACVTKVTGSIGLGFWWYDIITYSRCKNVGHALTRLPVWMVPALFCPIAGCMTTCLLNQNYPKKLDASNFAAGGAVTGLMVGACRKSGVLGVQTALVLAATFYSMRDLEQQGSKNPWFSKDLPTRGTWDSLPDYTMYRDRPKYTGWEEK